MVDHPPDALNTSEPVGGGKRMGGAADQLDANYSALSHVAFEGEADITQTARDVRDIKKCNIGPSSRELD